MARFGHLFLNKGAWNGRQLLSSKWIEVATSVQVPSTLIWAHAESEIDGRGGYGFNWWVNGRKADGKLLWPGAPADTFAAMGHNNNKLIVIPQWNIVIVRLGLDQKEVKLTDGVLGTFVAKVAESLIVKSGVD